MLFRLALGGSPGPENLLVCRVTISVGWSSTNATFRQSLLQLGNALGADLGAAEREPLQISQPCKMYQTRIGDLGAAEAEHLQTGQPLEMHQPGVSDLGGVEEELLQISQPLD